MENQPKIIKRADLDQAVSLESRLEMDEFGASRVSPEKKVIKPSEMNLWAKHEEIINSAKLEAQKIKEQAKKIYLQVEDRINEAKNKGFAQGREEGLAAVTEMLTRIQKENEELKASLEKQMVALVFEIASKVIGDTFKGSNEALVGMVKQALSASVGNELTVLLNPSDYERVKESQTQLMKSLHGAQVMNLRPSESVKPGSCVIESEMGTLEANLDYQLAAIKKALELNDDENA